MSEPSPESRPPTAWPELLLRRHRLALAIFLTAAVVSFVSMAREQPVFQSSATLLVGSDKAAAEPGLIFGTQAGILSRRPNLANHIEIIRSHALARMVLDTLPAELLRSFERRRGVDPAAALARGVAARPVRDADMIRLSVRASSPELARTLTLAYVDAYQAYTLARSRADISAVKSFVRSQLDVVASRLDSVELALETYKRAHRITDLSQETHALIERQAQLLGLYERARAERAGRDMELGYLLRSRPALAGLRGELARLEGERAGLLVQGYADSAPRVRAIARRAEAVAEIVDAQTGGEIPNLQSPIGNWQLAVGNCPLPAAGRVGELQAEVVRLEASEQSLGEVVADCDAQLGRLPLRERQLARLARDVEVDRQVHALLAQRYEETRIQEAGRLSAVTIVDPPLAGRKVRPDLRNSLLLALALGLAAAFAGTWCVDRLDTTLRRPEDIERQGATCIAAIPQLPELEPSSVRLEPLNPRTLGPLSLPVAARQPDSVAAEAFRVLRTNVQFAATAADTSFRTLVITSADPGEGKTTIAANLAIVIAQSGKRALLIDADLRKPRQHAVFHQRKKPGLTDTVMLGVPLEQAVRPSGTEGLDVLFAGTTPPSPVDFLNSTALAAFLKRASDLYDCVIMDTPPALVSADAAVLAARVDGVLLVARLGRTDLRALAQARRLLGQAGSRVLGIVANEQRPRRRYGYYRYRYRYYRYRATAEPSA